MDGHLNFSTGEHNIQGWRNRRRSCRTCLTFWPWLGEDDEVMPRLARLDAPGVLHYVIGRGIERRKIFLKRFDRNDFIARLAQLAEDGSMAVYAWGSLPNHSTCFARPKGGHYPRVCASCWRAMWWTSIENLCTFCTSVPYEEMNVLTWSKREKVVARRAFENAYANVKGGPLFYIV